MPAKYVVSIADTLLYFDAQRQPAPPFPEHAASEETKPEIKLIPPGQHPAAAHEWDEALGRFSAAQREAAEISVVT